MGRVAFNKHHPFVFAMRRGGCSVMRYVHPASSRHNLPGSIRSKAQQREKLAFEAELGSSPSARSAAGKDLD